MKLQRRFKTILLIILLVGIGALLFWLFSEGRRELAEQEKHPLNEVSRVTIQGGKGIVTLGKATQVKSGIVTALLQPISYREEIQAYGVVLELQTLVDLRKNLIDLRKNLVELRNNHATAKAQLEKALAGLEASRKQYDRLKTLYEDDRNVSQKALQAGEAVWRSDEANVEASRQGLRAAQEALRAGEETLNVLEASARQQWGSVLTKWLFEGSPPFYKLIRQEDFLLQITLPSGARISPTPETVSVQTPGGALVSAHFVSPSAQTDPRIQGMSFFYLAPARGTNLLPGMNVAASMPAGPRVRGFFLPGSAVVWSQGKAWVYIQNDKERFVRRRVSTKTPAKNGYFVMKGFKREDRIVVKGAQLLLSQEFRTKTQTSEEEED
jgi:multidrug efflux pump subunit AcrA (membrane-fusion protein)